LQASVSYRCNDITFGWGYKWKTNWTPCAAEMLQPWDLHSLEFSLGIMILMVTHIVAMHCMTCVMLVWIIFCNDDSDVKKAVDLYNAIGPSDSLPSDVFGQKSKGPIQVGIMKFLKKADASSVDKSNAPKLTFCKRNPGQQNPLPKQEKEKVESGTCSMEAENELNNKMENEVGDKESGGNGSRTLLFSSSPPSITMISQTL
jgi:hypothetical protein